MPDLRRVDSRDCPGCRTLGFVMGRRGLSRKETGRLPRGLRPGRGKKSELELVTYSCPHCNRRWSLIRRSVSAQSKRVQQ